MKLVNNRCLNYFGFYFLKLISSIQQKAQIRGQNNHKQANREECVLSMGKSRGSKFQSLGSSTEKNLILGSHQYYLTVVRSGTEPLTKMKLRPFSL